MFWTLYENFRPQMKDYQTKLRAKSVKVCVNGLLMSKSGIEDERRRPYLYMNM